MAETSPSVSGIAHASAGSPLHELAKGLLRSVFGFESFRPLQKEIVGEVLSGRDTLAILPTGGGKSLCYQLPALLLPGYTLVISPLIALMRDQIDSLVELGVPAVFLNSSLSQEDYSTAVSRVLSGEIKLLYVAPEGLSGGRLSNLLDVAPPSLLVVDEAHCISEWGHDFRPDYRRIAGLRSRFPDIACLAVTATAPGRVREDIASSLELRNPARFIASFDRPNLVIGVRPRKAAKEFLLDLARRDPEASGIVYCGSRAKTEDFAAHLRDHGVRAVAYHAGLASADRESAQTAFIRDDVQIVTATVAFGMGIDKPDVRWVVHADLPSSVESYYQEIGRAGRDGLPAECILLYSWGDEIRTSMLFSELDDEQRGAALSRLDEMVRYARSESCRRRLLLAHFGERYLSHDCKACDNCLRAASSLGPELDYTIPALKLLSCALRARETCPARELVDILLGTPSPVTEGKNHESLSTWGIGSELDRASWMDLARVLVARGFMISHPETGTLSLSTEGRRLLKERGPFRSLPLSPARLVKKSSSVTPRPATDSGPVSPSRSPVQPDSGPVPAPNRDTRLQPDSVTKKRSNGKASRQKTPDQVPLSPRPHELSEADTILFLALRKKRKEIADAAGVPPYVIFPDRTLEAMALTRPRTLAALGELFGVGGTKLLRYGSIFLAVIDEYLHMSGKD